MASVISIPLFLPLALLFSARAWCQTRAADPPLIHCGRFNGTVAETAERTTSTHTGTGLLVRGATQTRSSSQKPIVRPVHEHRYLARILLSRAERELNIEMFPGYTTTTVSWMSAESGWHPTTPVMNAHSGPTGCWTALIQSSGECMNRPCHSVFVVTPAQHTLPLFTGHGAAVQLISGVGPVA